MILPDNQIYIIPTPKDKPVKLVFEDNAQHTPWEEVRKPNEYEISREILWCLKSMKYRYNLTTQQYRSEKGKIKHHQQEVLNFIKRRDINKYNNLILWMDKEERHFGCTRKETFNVNQFIQSTIGVITISKEGAK